MNDPLTHDIVAEAEQAMANRPPHRRRAPAPKPPEKEPAPKRESKTYGELLDKVKAAETQTHNFAAGHTLDHFIKGGIAMLNQNTVPLPQRWKGSIFEKLEPFQKPILDLLEKKAAYDLEHQKFTADQALREFNRRVAEFEKDPIKLEVPDKEKIRLEYSQRRIAIMGLFTRNYGAEFLELMEKAATALLEVVEVELEQLLIEDAEEAAEFELPDLFVPDYCSLSLLRCHTTIASGLRILAQEREECARVPSGNAPHYRVGGNEGLLKLLLLPGPQK